MRLFASHHDLSTQLDHIFFLVDKDNREAPVKFKSYKVGRIVRSEMAGKVIVFSDLSMFPLPCLMSSPL